MAKLNLTTTDKTNHYMGALTSEGAVERTASGKTKFINKRKRDEDDEAVDDYGEEEEFNKEAASNQRNIDRMLGKQFKAKVFFFCFCII